MNQSDLQTVYHGLSRCLRTLPLVLVAAIFVGLTAQVSASVCTLADHIRSANTNTAVGFCPAGTSHDIITITEDIVLTEPLPPITGTITIEGGGHTISGTGKFRVFDVDNDGRLTIKQLTLIEGNGGRSGGGAVRAQRNAQIMVENSAFRNNRARFGDAISARHHSVVTVNHSSFNSNAAETGGAIQLASSEASIDNSSFSQNLATESGGAIQIYRGEIAIGNSTLFSNVAGTGGGIYVSGGDVTLTHLTMLDNLASGSEGAGLRQEFRRGSLNLHNSIIAGRTTASLCSARIKQNVGNLIEDWSCNPEYGGDPMLERIEGASLAFAPRDDSPVINAAYPMFCLERDQIGTARPFGAACEIGAIESISASARVTGSLAGVCTLADRILAANTNQAVGYCPAGTDHDIINLTEDISLRLPLPPITGTITVEGGEHTISGDGNFRIFLVNGGNLTVNNLTLMDGFSEDGGGAIQVRAGGWLTVNNSAFTGNSAGLNGGAIDLTGSTRGVSSDPRISNLVLFSQGSGLTVNKSTFINNRSGSSGGALNIYGRTRISNSSFVKNSAQSRGGGVTGFGEMSISNSTFSGNGAWLSGALDVSGNVTLTHLTIVDSVSSSSFEGSGRTLTANGNVRLRNSIIAGHVRRDALSTGQATKGGAIRLMHGGRVTATNVAFSHNSAAEGGAIVVESADAIMNLRDSIFVGNSAVNSGGALVLDGGTANISGNAFLANRAGAGQVGGAIEARRGNLAISNSAFSGNWSGTGGVNCIQSNDGALADVSLLDDNARRIAGGIYYQSGSLTLRNSIATGSESCEE